MGCESIFITPGSPWENPYIESFIGKLRDECLNRELFSNLSEAQAVVEAWRPKSEAPVAHMTRRGAGVKHHWGQLCQGVRKLAS